MTILDWLAIASLSVAILSLLFLIFNIIMFIRRGKKLHQYTRIRVKNKKKRRLLLKRKQEMEKKRKKSIVFAVLFFLLMIFGGATSAYTVYYQASNLSVDDKKALVSGYFYLRDTEAQLNNVKTEVSDELITDLNNLSARIAAFALNKADYRISEEGQNQLNRYYTSMKEYGLNVSSRLSQVKQNPEIVDELMTDMEKVKKNEKKVFETFKVNEQALKEKL